MSDSEMPHDISLVACQAIGPTVSLSRENCVMLDTSVDLSGPQLYVHRKVFAWLPGLQERLFLLYIHNLGIG